MKNFSIIGVLLVFALFGCGTGGGMKSDNTPAPRMISTSPTGTNVPVATITAITVNYNQDIVCSGDNFTVLANGAAVSGSESCPNGVATFTPAVAIASGVTYTVTISGIANSVERESAPYTWSFTTEMPKWTFPDGAEINDSNINPTTGEMYFTGGHTYSTGQTSSFTYNGSVISGAFFGKFNADGTIGWLKEFQVPGFTLYWADFIKLSPDGNTIYLFWRKRSLTNPNQGGMSDGIAVSSFDVNGNYIWTKEIDTHTGGPLAFAVDNTGEYAVGIVSSYNDPGVYKIDASGNVVWQTSVKPESGGTQVSNAYASGGYLFVTGDMGGNFAGFTEQGAEDSFVVKYDATNGNLIWVNQQGAVSSLTTGIGVTAILSGPSAGVYVSGENSSSFFLQKYDLVDGSLIWSKDQATAGEIIADATGFYIGGGLSKVTFDGVLIWNVNAGTYGINVFGNTVFAVKWLDNSFSLYNATTGNML